MADLSIRELAAKLGVSHTAIRNAIADIELETGKKLGKSQGQGKATLLDSYAQELIASKFFKPATSKESASASGGEIVHRSAMTYGVPGLAPVTVHRVKADLVAIDEAKTEYQEIGQQAVINLAQLAQQYTLVKGVQTFREIDATFEGVKASALNSTLSELGKSGGATDLQE
ncbi:MAG TPA: HTH domain-containing protein [Leptolyngbyaceae cyanobacterium M33_DOE_097]|uniref:HTH domain-containing protein n=1 Tax=Oscillatoriales cyanobacterium SpSt-418 TaxID=2282169 RepID=A0A7C3KFE9_9CYAN|nr:HTH domain-containing protein [Leptolyngbyaceae cyanobacterium M33_DOE_097]